MKDRHRGGDPGFNARLALEAIKGVKTIQEVAKGFAVHPVLISELKETMAHDSASGGTASAGMAGHSGKVLVWAVSNTLGTGASLEALEMARVPAARFPRFSTPTTSGSSPRPNGSVA